jgi:hypothetical protein
MTARAFRPFALLSPTEGFSRYPHHTLRSFGTGSGAFSLSATLRLPGFGSQEDSWLAP